MHMQPVFKENDFVKVKENAVSEDLFERGVCLPSDTKMTVEEQSRVIEIIKKLWKWLFECILIHKYNIQWKMETKAKAKVEGDW